MWGTRVTPFDHGRVKTGTRWRVSDQAHAPTALLRGKSSMYPLNRRLGGAPMLVGAL